MVDLSMGPIPLCTVRIHGRSSTFWLTDPDDASPPLPLSARRAQLAEIIRHLEEAKGDPEEIAGLQQALAALDRFIEVHGNLFAADGTLLAPKAPGASR